ncbi:hypothetical protein DU475_16085 [Rhodopseudomonas sp. WA056]|uniref:pentapeptide repeat-containing protein n=1 Tax=Rhodopseudomonas sp. WA056 TaxID=2269367 RepID=UPI0013E0B510|nr:pentapeptide repeat-containing protein [Rhodopseudomonas sp. WA056]NEW88772.1 hypothetical protein [Rhodopseudomonas sp. WA056]
MKTISHTDDLLSEEDWKLIRKLLDFPETNFVEQAKLCGLDPARDFQQLDLSNVDFSNCDLRGFDFSGTDLRGAFGVNLTWEVGDPVLDGADTSDSLFTHQLQQQRYFRDHPDDLALVKRLSTDYWANTITRIDDLIQSRNNPVRATKISHAVFAAHKDNSVRTHILFLIRSTSASDSKYFIYDSLSKSWNDPGQTDSCLRILITLFGDSGQPFNWLLKYLKHPDDTVRKTAFFGLIKSPKFTSGLAEIKAYITACRDRVQRRAFVGKTAKLLGSETDAALYNYKEGNYFDFRDTLTRQSLIDTRNPRSFAHIVEEARISKQSINIEVITEEQLQRRIRLIQQFGQAFGIYFKYIIASGTTIELGNNDGISTDRAGPER